MVVLVYMCARQSELQEKNKQFYKQSEYKYENDLVTKSFPLYVMGGPHNILPHPYLFTHMQYGWREPL